MNCIVICLDTFRADCIRYLGAQHMRTPNLDALARDGVWFDNAYAEALPTLPVRRSLFTGMRGFPWRWVRDTMGSSPNAVNIPGWHGVPPHQPTLAERLSRAGYVTGFVADTPHLFKPTMNFTRGFMNWEFFRGQEADPHRLGTPAELHADRYSHHPDDLPFWFRQWLWNIKDRRTEEDYTFPRCIRRAIQFMEESRELHPFFLWIDSFEAHEPWQPPSAYADAYMDAPWQGVEPVAPRNETWTPAEEERVRALYYGSLTFMDKWIGVLLDHLAESGLLDETVVVFTSDHGTQLNEHGEFGKTSKHMNAYTTRVNMLVRHPDGPRDTVVTPFVQHIDVAPTILRWLGVPHDRMDGEDMWPLATGQRDSLRDWVLAVWAYEASVRDHTWNAVVNVQEPDPQWKLYRIDQDRDNFDDVAPRYPDVVATQRTRLEGFLGEPLPARLPSVRPGSNYPMQDFLRARLQRE